VTLFYPYLQSLNFNNKSTQPGSSFFIVFVQLPQAVSLFNSTSSVFAYKSRQTLILAAFAKKAAYFETLVL
jgi:hypothetical protein